MDISNEFFKPEKSESINYKEIETIVRMGLTAPSGDNSQHWRFTWNEKTLAIFYVPELGKHALNNGMHASWLSLGCLVEAVRIAASGFKLQTSETYEFTDRPDVPVVKISFNKKEIKTDPLISDVFKRKTTRVPFSAEKISDKVWELMGIEASRFENTQFSILKSIPDDLHSYILSCDPLMWKNQKVATDFLKWVRLSEEQTQRTTNGMPWQTLGMSKADVLPFYFLKRWPILIKILWPVGLGMKIARNAAQLLPKSTSIYGIAVKDNQPESLLEAGQMAYRLWLILTSENVAVQPLSLSSLTGFDILNGVAPHLSNPGTLEKYKNGLKLLRKHFQFNPGWHPVWMFRVGKVDNKSVMMKTPREDVNEKLLIYTRNY